MKQTIARAFARSLAGVLVGSLLKIMHIPMADIVVTAGLAISAVFIVLGIISTWRDDSLSTGEKVLWSVMLFITPVGPLIFMLMRYPKLSNA